MAQTVIRGTQILNNTVQRQDLDTSTVGQAVVTKLVQGSGITLSSTGADSGTGDVTVNSPDTVSTDVGNIAVLGSDSHILVPQSQIWSVRLRSFNAIGNPTFEVDQRNIGAALTNPADQTWLLDRYRLRKTALTATVNTALQTGLVTLPGTNFAITNNFLRFTVGTAQASLAAGDFYVVDHYAEGPRWRELSSDVHSVSLLVRSSVAGLAFSLALMDGSATRTLTKLCTIPSSNTWALIALPALPIWGAGGSWTAAPGSFGYYFRISLACGTTFGSPANDTFQTGNFIGAVGRSNFLATASATFDIAWIGHEPGSLCTTPQDCPFTANLDDCLRYFVKSAPYAVAYNAIQNAGCLGLWTNAAGPVQYANFAFRKIMAKTPTLTFYSTATGAANTVRNITGASDLAVASTVGYVCDAGIIGFQLSATPAANQSTQGNWQADTGW